MIKILKINTSKIFLKSRKAQIGTTLTWIVAFVIIFFIMLLFFGGCAFLSGEKFLSGERNIIGLDEGQDLESLYNQRLLTKILNTPVDEKKTIKDLIFEFQLSRDESLKRKIKEEVEGILGSDENINYYFFKVTYDLDKPTEDYILARGESLDSPKEIFELNLFLNEQKINVGLCLDKKEIKRYVKRREKDTIVIHYTANPSAQGAISSMKSRGLGAHYVIDRDGTILECEIGWGNRLKICVAKDISEIQGKWERKTAYHAGCEPDRPQCFQDYDKKPFPGENCCRRKINERGRLVEDFNDRSIGIELVNVGYLCEGTYCESEGRGEEFEWYFKEEEGEEGFCGTRNAIWEEYPKEQIESLVNLVAEIVLRHNILIDREHIIGHDEVDPCRKKDPGPAFPWEEFIEDLKSKEEI